VTVRNPFVSSKPDAEYKTAELTISWEVRNVSNEASRKACCGREVEDIELQQTVELSGGESKTVKFAPEQSQN